MTTVTVNMSASARMLERRLQRILEFATLTLNAVDLFPDEQRVCSPHGALFTMGAWREPATPGTRMDMQFAPGQDTPAVKAMSRSWLLRQSLADAVAAFNSYLEVFRPVVAVVRKGAAEADAEWWNRTVSSRPRRREFHGAGLPEKFQILRSLGLPQTESLARIEPCVLSINAVRNCFVHRGGRVGPGDVAQGSAAMACRWMRCAIYLTDADGTQEEVTFLDGQPTRGAESISVQMEELVERTVPVGESLVLSAQDLHDILWTLVRAGVRHAEAISQLAIANGFGPSERITP
jgi:hypothetical protein